MKTNHKLALALLAGALIGVAGARFSHAYQIKTPPGYAFVEVHATDPLSGSPCWCHAQEHAVERGKPARKTQHHQSGADIIRRPTRRSTGRSGKVRRRAAASESLDPIAKAVRLGMVPDGIVFLARGVTEGE